MNADVYQSKRLTKITVCLLILGIITSMTTPFLQEAEACEAAHVICAGAFGVATAYCKKTDTSWWECSLAMAAAAATCAAAFALCGSS